MKEQKREAANTEKDNQEYLERQKLTVIITEPEWMQAVHVLGLQGIGKTNPLCWLFFNTLRGGLSDLSPIVPVSSRGDRRGPLGGAELGWRRDVEGAASDAPRGGPKADGFGRAVDEVAAWLERYAALVAPASVLRARDGNTGVALGVTGAILYMHLAMAQLVIHVTESRWRNFFHAQLSGPLLATLVATAVMVAGAALERQGAGGLVALAGLIAACATVLPLSIYLLPEQIRPTELFRKMDTAAAWLRGAVRLPIRSVLRLPAIEVGAG